jgi:hypothetical protein
VKHLAIFLATAAMAVVTTTWLAAAEAGATADAWLADTNGYPPEIGPFAVASNRFAALRAEAIGGRLRIVLPPDGLATNARVVVHFSFDEPGHWPARDWESTPMIRGDRQFDSLVRVTEVEVPLVYFVSLTEPDKAGGGIASNTIVSPLRVCRPARAGLEAPSHPFWPYLEGFEGALTGWRLLTPETPALATDPAARSGKSALRVTLPAGRTSVTIGTTRIRGWHATLRDAAGVRLWLRTKSGEARARFTLLANAGTSRQEMVVFPRQENLGPQWRPVDLWFAELPSWRPTALDLLSIDFIGQGPLEMLVDDVQLLGRWRLEP